MTLCEVCNNPTIGISVDEWCSYTCVKCKKTQWVKDGPLSDADRAFMRILEEEYSNNE